MAKNRSPDSAVSVNTDTPIETSLINSEKVQSSPPQGHESSVQMTDVSGTVVTINNKSANANDKMYLQREASHKNAINQREIIAFD